MHTEERFGTQVIQKDCGSTPTAVKRLQRCQELLRFLSERNVQRVWFTDEITLTVAMPVNSQNNRVYSAAEKKSNADPRRLIRERQHFRLFSRGITVLVGVSKMGNTSLVFVEPSAQINSECYCNNPLERNLIIT